MSELGLNSLELLGTVGVWFCSSIAASLSDVSLHAEFVRHRFRVIFRISGSNPLKLLCLTLKNRVIDLLVWTPMSTGPSPAVAKRQHWARLCQVLCLWAVGCLKNCGVSSGSVSKLIQPVIKPSVDF